MLHTIQDSVARREWQEAALESDDRLIRRFIDTLQLFTGEERTMTVDQIITFLAIAQDGGASTMTEMASKLDTTVPHLAKKVETFGEGRSGVKTTGWGFVEKIPGVKESAKHLRLSRDGSMFFAKVRNSLRGGGNLQ